MRDFWKKAAASEVLISEMRNFWKKGGRTKSLFSEIRNFILGTNNLRGFKRIPASITENWGGRTANAG